MVSDADILPVTNMLIVITLHSITFVGSNHSVHSVSLFFGFVIEIVGRWRWVRGRQTTGKCAAEMHTNELGGSFRNA